MAGSLGCFAAFDVGGTKTALLLADRTGKRLGVFHEPTESGLVLPIPYRDGWAHLAVSQQMTRLLESGLEETGCREILGIGIGAAGPIDGGDLRNPPNVGASADEAVPPLRPLYVPLIAPLQEAFGKPVLMRNDCRAAVLGEVYFGTGRSVPDKSKLFLVYVTLSTGFGAGVWDGGHLVVGKDGNAGEAGHFVVEEDGLLCGCGNRGCVEAYCSGSGIVRNARGRLSRTGRSDEAGYGEVLRRLAQAAARAAGERPGSDGASLDPFVTPPLVFEAAGLGDALARQTIEDAVRGAGIAFADIANAYDPEVISVGGGLAQAHPELLPRIDEEMRRHLNVRAPIVQATPLGDETVLYGALVLARETAPPGCDG